MIRIFIGDDTRVSVALSVLAYSIRARASQPTAIIPLRLNQLEGVLKRQRDPKQSTDFSFSRFLTPYLSDYEGWSIFMDNDMLVLDDIAKLWACRDDRYAVMVVKHDQHVEKDAKFLNAVQTRYEKKNWSSVMLFNNAKCRALTPEYVNTASGLELHQFKWLGDDNLIGELPHRWNHLVDCDPPNPDVSNVHFTLGGPFFDEFRDGEYAAEWFKEREAMLYCEQKSR